MGRETTALSAAEEAAFQQWVRANQITDVDHPQSYYDYRGFWKQNPTFRRENPDDHFTDRYKQHGHESFSQESQYSSGPSDGGMWVGSGKNEKLLAQPRMAVSHALTGLKKAGQR